MQGSDQDLISSFPDNLNISPLSESTQKRELVSQSQRGPSPRAFFIVEMRWTFIIFQLFTFLLCDIGIYHKAITLRILPAKSNPLTNRVNLDMNKFHIVKGTTIKIGMMLGFEDSINTLTTISREAEAAGIYSLYTVDAGRSATITAAAVTIC